MAREKTNWSELPAWKDPWWQSDATLFTAAVLIVGASVLLSTSAEAVSLGSNPLPPLCLSVRLFDVECFGCGLTRSFVFMGHGQIAPAFSMHKLGPLLWAALAFQIPWRGYWLVRRRPDSAPR